MLILFGSKTLRTAADAFRRQKWKVLRVALQTGVATLATYLLIDRIAPEHLSWGIISVLFTIGVSADLSYRNAMGRIVGASIGAFVGLTATYTLGGPVILSLIPAVVVANMIATIRPSLQYAAVTAAILSLQPMPELAGTIGRMVAIFAGTIIGAGAGLLIWPIRGRRRVELALRDALDDCRVLLELIDQGVEADDHHERDVVHSRFLGHLEAARARVQETRFSSTLRSGAGLRDAVHGAEALWHALIILDRAVREERREVSHETLEELRPLADEMRRQADDYLACLIDVVTLPQADAPSTDGLREAARQARSGVAELARKETSEGPLCARALQASAFGVDETERQLLALGEALLQRPAPDEGGGS